MSVLPPEEPTTVAEIGSPAADPRVARTPPRFRWLARLLAVAALYVGFLVAIRVWWGWEAQKRFDTAVAKYRALGQPVLIEGFRREPAPGEETWRPFMDRLFAARKPVIGMLHLPALPGAPHHAGDWPQLIERTLGDAQTLVDGGVHGLIVENFGDRPFFPRRVPRATVACLTHVAGRVRERYPSVPLGINVLRNDGESGIGVALAVGADFIRVNVLCGARVTDQGVLEGIAHRLLRLRSRLGAGAIRIFADVSVKHSTPVGPGLPIEQEVADVIQRGGADAVVVSGTGTGEATDLALLKRVTAVARGTPVFVGSGVTAQNVHEYLPHCDGLIVGTSLKVDGKASNPVDPARVGALVQGAS